MKWRLKKTRGGSSPSSSGGVVWVRLLMGLLAFVILFSFLHFRWVKIDLLELGKPSPRFLVARADFSYPNEEATAVARQELIRRTGGIYRISPQEIQIRLTVQEKKEPPFPKELEELLLAFRFAKPQTIQIATEVELPGAALLLEIPQEPAEPLPLPPIVWRQAGREWTSTEWSPSLQEALLKELSQQNWELVEDQQMTRLLHQRIGGGMQVVESRVLVGARLIDRGEVVTSRHLAMIEAHNRALRAQHLLFSPVRIVGSALLTLLILLLATAYLRSYLPLVWKEGRRLCLLTVILILTLSFAKGAEWLFLEGSPRLIEFVRYPLFVPFAAILLAALLGVRVASFGIVFLSLILTFTLPIDRSAFLLLNFLTALTMVLPVHSMRQRKEVFVLCGKGWLCAALLLISFHLYSQTFLTLAMGIDLLTSFLFLLFTAILVIGLLPLFESVFRILTESLLMELLDPSHPLLRRLHLEAPGTYQHSLVAANLAEAAADAIGANALFCRVGALYHDIGKLVGPQIFTENQQGGVNLHSLWTPLESAQVIMSHVADGVAIAKKARLPEPIIDVIREHHGTTRVLYFYVKAMEAREEGDPPVDEAAFRYPGPKPRRREIALIMMADTLEAASRSLPERSEEEVTALVERLLSEKIKDGQLDEAELTFADYHKAKRAFVSALLAITHTRVHYPLPPAGAGDEPLNEPSAEK